MKPYKKLLHKMTLMLKEENPNQQWSTIDDGKFWCSCGFTWTLRLTDEALLPEEFWPLIGYEGLSEAHKKWAQEREINDNMS